MRESLEHQNERNGGLNDLSKKEKGRWIDGHECLALAQLDKTIIIKAL